MGGITSQLALHKDKRLVPIRLMVRKISGIGEDMLLVRVLGVRYPLGCRSQVVSKVGMPN
jgi:hypothetical protein